MSEEKIKTSSKLLLLLSIMNLILAVINLIIRNKK